MKPTIVPTLTAFWVLLSQAAFSQISPEAREVIDAYNEATGGSEAKAAIQTIIQTGEWELPSQAIKGSMTIYYQRPGSFATVTEIPDVGTVRTCIKDGQAWEDNSITGFRDLGDTELQQAIKQAYMFPETRLDDLYSKATLNEPRSDGMTTVLLVDSDGFEETWYFDPFTHYLTEIQRTLDAGSRGSYRVKEKMNSYLPVGNLTMPHHTETSTPAFKIITKVEKTTFNTPIPDYIFKKPEIR